MKQAGISQAQIADELGVRRSFIWIYRFMPTAYMLYNAARRQGG